MKKVFALLVRLLTWQSIIDRREPKWNEGCENDLSGDSFSAEKLLMSLQRESIQKWAIFSSSIILSLIAVIIYCTAIHCKT